MWLWDSLISLLLGLVLPTTFTLSRPGIGLLHELCLNALTRTENVEMAKAALFVFQALYR